MSVAKPIPGLLVAAGGIVLNESRVLLVQDSRSAEWGLPRGKLRRGESPLKAALREVSEETGYTVKAESYVGCITYVLGTTPKVVLYWIMSASGKQGQIDKREISECRWMSRSEGLRELIRPGERELLRNAWRMVRS